MRDHEGKHREGPRRGYESAWTASAQRGAERVVRGDSQRKRKAVRSAGLGRFWAVTGRVSNTSVKESNPIDGTICPLNFLHRPEARQYAVLPSMPDIARLLKCSE
ncbi:hypothetical protein EJB05_00945, partial [Eragrostis curvula]